MMRNGIEAAPGTVFRVFKVRSVTKYGEKNYDYTLVRVDEQGNLTDPTNPNNVLELGQRSMKEQMRRVPRLPSSSTSLKSSAPIVAAAASTDAEVAANKLAEGDSESERLPSLPLNTNKLGWIRRLIRWVKWIKR